MATDYEATLIQIHADSGVHWNQIGTTEASISLSDYVQEGTQPLPEESIEG